MSVATKNILLQHVDIGKACQKKAWRQHHKRECTIFKAGREKLRDIRADIWVDDKESEANTKEESKEKDGAGEGDTQEKHVEVDESADLEDVYFDIFDNCVRMTIRFVMLFKAGQSRASMKDSPFDHLSWNIQERQLSADAEERYTEIVKLVKELTHTSFNVDEIFGWARMLDESRRKLQLPILKGPNQPPHIGSMVSPGWFIDPILSMIQHSCEPNARPVVEDGKIWALALKGIPVNGEVTFNYVPDHLQYDYLLRDDTLQTEWGIDCCCPLCQKGRTKLPDEEWHDFAELLSQVSRHTMDDPHCDPKTIVQIDLWIPRLEKLGYGLHGEYFSIYRRLWWIRLCQCYGKKRYKETLHACLKLYVEIELGHIGNEERIDTVYVLCDLLDPAAYVRRVKDEGWTGLPPDIKRELVDLHCCIRIRYNRMVSRCFGDSADIVRFEKEAYQQHLGQVEEEIGSRRTMTQGDIMSSRTNMHEGFNELLDCVGLIVIDDPTVLDKLLG
ncbi:hypothetical protein ONS95_000300 [Cadophora gregata]|uniref:uncharacterized protein n=1 Tax=Cadophora gregata TaxID=51156 RepID=UPI0026DCBF7A|nr:uncharacterized protein ONS95_000300 [Cadophora gregata]KAK0125696.1 hypothetical protein ONS96_009529 [Cadophora gregata f. sp. sojae]KAK0128325.1 hypothetical protein ONS95_000300 [Cadophora gregata]